MRLLSIERGGGEGPGIAALAGRNSVEFHVFVTPISRDEKDEPMTSTEDSSQHAPEPPVERRHGLVLTPAAAAKATELLAAEGREDVALRVSVQPGGCSGLRYQLFFDERHLDGDEEQVYGSLRVVVDRMSVPYLSGATVDFADTISQQGFVIENPNAAGSCACGDSFH